MRLDTIAEGIETSDQLRRLHGLGCRIGQGFHFARPMPGDALAAYFAQAA
jgi:EAL domain-containing protein (putative c-di-GMP-specific phosphodiesterase class I)